MMKKIEFIVDDKKQDYPSNIWRRGCEIYAEDGVLDAYACNNDTACLTVRGTIDYKVVIHKNKDEVNIECNCPCFGGCKHEVAALCYLKEHPILKVLDQPFDMDVGKLDEFKLAVQEQLYEIEQEDESDDYIELEERLQELYNMIQDENYADIKMKMIIYLWENFSIDENLWEIMMEAFIVNPSAVKQVIQMIEEPYMLSMINEALTVIVEEKQESYEELISCLIKKQKQLESR